MKTFTEEEFKASQQVLEDIKQTPFNNLKSIYMAGEINMRAELNPVINTLIKTLKDLQQVLIEAKLTIHAKGIEVLLKKYN